MTTHSSKTKIPAHPDANRDPITGSPGAHPVGSGVGAAGGAGAGAAIGGAVGGPVGAGVGAVVGGVAGGLAGKGVAEAVNPTAEDAYWREAYTKSPYYEPGRTYDDYSGAYRTGWEGYARYGSAGRDYQEVEPVLREDYHVNRGRSNLQWDQAKGSVREAWNHVKDAGRSGTAAVTGSRPGTAGGETTRIGKESISTLNSFLRGEMSAVATYKQALDKVGTSGSPRRQVIDECLNSHLKRVELLRQHILRLGGDPSDSSGLWGAFAQLYEAGAKLFGETATINALESGEDHGLHDFKRDLHQLDPESRRFVEAQILPEQERTHRMMSDLKHSL
jgi:hypothetical protein